MQEYYDLMIFRIEAMGGSVPSQETDAIAEFWDEIDQFLPPSGQLVLARSDDGTLVGCGSLKSISPTKGEMKRLVVKPETRGHGVGHRLVGMSVDAARAMGQKTLYFDTLRNNVEMRGLCQKLGFKEIEFYPESATYRLIPELKPIMCFYSIDL